MGGCAGLWLIVASSAPAFGARQGEQGVQLTISYYGDLFGNTSGGVKQGSGYDGRLGAIVDADLGKLAGWGGAKFHLSLHQVHGSEFSGNHLANLMKVRRC